MRSCWYKGVADAADRGMMVVVVVEARETPVEQKVKDTWSVVTCSHTIRFPIVVIIIIVVARHRANVPRPDPPLYRLFMPSSPHSVGCGCCSYRQSTACHFHFMHLHIYSQHYFIQSVLVLWGKISSNIKIIYIYFIMMRGFFVFNFIKSTKLNRCF